MRLGEEVQALLRATLIRQAAPPVGSGHRLPFGNRTSTTVSGTGIATRMSSTTYDGNGLFPTVTTNALGQSESWSFDSPR